ncbi:hypothetical protein SRHO_G00201710 [Serrasalmus rhombeus]
MRAHQQRCFSVFTWTFNQTNCALCATCRVVSEERTLPFPTAPLYGHRPAFSPVTIEGSCRPVLTHTALPARFSEPPGGSLTSPSDTGALKAARLEL